jgi:hypothetical protein
MDRKTSNRLTIVLIFVILLLVGSVNSAMITLSSNLPFMLQQSYLRAMNKLQPPVSLAMPKDYL